jgi:type IV pilus assembly protein PilP
MKPNKITIITSLLFTSLISGCGSSHEDIEQWMKSTRSTQKGKIKPLPLPKAIIHIPFLAKNDPFILKQIIATNSQNNKYAPNPDRRKEPLEAYKLDNLRMVGTILKDKTMYALILAPDNTINYVTKNNYMGTNYGKVTKIDDSGITLEERVKNSDDQWEIKITTFYIDDSK